MATVNKKLLGFQKTMDSSFEEILGRLLTATGSKSETELASALGIRQPSISTARIRKAVPQKWVVDIAKSYGVSADWLLFGQGEILRNDATRPLHDSATPTTPPGSSHRQYGKAAEKFGLCLIKKVKARLSAGRGSLETEGDIDGFYAFREDWMAGKGNPERMALMDVFGNSMEPVICDGDTVLVDEAQREIRTGRIYAIGLDDEVVVKRVDKVPGRLVLRSMNNSYEPVYIDTTREDMNVRIIGRVIWWCREAR